MAVRSILDQTALSHPGRTWRGMPSGQLVRDVCAKFRCAWLRAADKPELAITRTKYNAAVLPFDRFI